MEGFGANGLVVGRAGKRSIQKKQPGASAWTSFLECIIIIIIIIIFTCCISQRLCNTLQRSVDLTQEGSPID